MTRVCLEEEYRTPAVGNPENQGLPQLGISKYPLKGSKRKQPEDGEKCGRKTNIQRIIEIDTRLIESGQCLTLK